MQLGSESWRTQTKVRVQCGQGGETGQGGRDGRGGEEFSEVVRVMKW